MSATGPDRAPCIGVLYPGRPCAVGEYDDFPNQASFPVELFTEFIEAPDSHVVADLFTTGEFDRLAEGGRRLLDRRPDVVLWACTSGSFVYGKEGARDQVQAIADATGVVTTSTSLAFVAALESLGWRKVAVLGPYPPDLLAYFETFLGDNGIDVVSITAMDSPTGTHSASLGLDEFSVALGRLVLDDVDCVLLPDTAAFGLAVASALSEAAQRPVLAANPVSLWHATRMVGVCSREPLFGVLADAQLPGATS